MNEFAWLIEFPHIDGAPTYWGKTITGLGVTSEHLDAIRFARKEDAEAIISDKVHLGGVWHEAKATEHGWS